MTLCSLLYVSKSALDDGRANAVVQTIVEGSRSANLDIAVTGALIFTGRHFAQILEGERAAVEGLMEVIGNDCRHTDLNIVAQTNITERRFSGWNLAYLGPSQFVSRHVTQLLGQTNLEQQRRAAAWVTDLMAEFTAAVPAP